MLTIEAVLNSNASSLDVGDNDFGRIPRLRCEWPARQRLSEVRNIDEEITCKDQGRHSQNWKKICVDCVNKLKPK